MINCSNTLAHAQHAAKGDTMQYRIAASSPRCHAKSIKTKNQIMLHSHCVPPAMLRLIGSCKLTAIDGNLRFLSVHVIFWPAFNRPGYAWNAAFIF